MASKRRGRRDRGRPTASRPAQSTYSQFLSRYPLLDIPTGSIVADEPPTPDEVLMMAESRDLLGQALDGLPARTSEMVRLYFGVDCDPIPMEEVGKIMGGLTRERVRQIVLAALIQLRRHGDLADATPFTVSRRAAPARIDLKDYERVEQICRMRTLAVAYEEAGQAAGLMATSTAPHIAEVLNKRAMRLLDKSNSLIVDAARLRKERSERNHLDLLERLAREREQTLARELEADEIRRKQRDDMRAQQEKLLREAELQRDLEQRKQQRRPKRQRLKPARRSPIVAIAPPVPQPRQTPDLQLMLRSLDDQLEELHRERAARAHEASEDEWTEFELRLRRLHSKQAAMRRSLRKRQSGSSG